MNIMRWQFWSERNQSQLMPKGWLTVSNIVSISHDYAYQVCSPTTFDSLVKYFGLYITQNVVLSKTNALKNVKTCVHVSLKKQLVVVCGMDKLFYFSYSQFSFCERIYLWQFMKLFENPLVYKHFALKYPMASIHFFKEYIFASIISMIFKTYRN